VTPRVPDHQGVVVFWYLLMCIGGNLRNGLKVTLYSEIEPGVGLGSSASFSTCLSSSLLKYFGHIKCENNIISAEEKDLINKWAFIGEKIFHGTPSGIDNTTCTYGGAVYLKKVKWKV